MKMSSSSQHSKLLEVRPGLFRIQWDFEDMDDEGTYKKKLKLSGSQIRRSYDITYNLNKVTEDSYLKRGFKFKYKIIVEENNESDSEQESKTRGPVYMWINSQVPSKNEMSLKRQRGSARWKGRRASLTPRKSFTLWIDFGTCTENEQILVNGIANMFYSQALCDVTFHFSDGRTIGGHVLILSAVNPVFSALFKSSDTAERKVEIDNIKYEVFWDILTYLYTGKVPELNEKDDGMIQLLYQGADCFGVEMLKRECIDVLLEKIAADNAVTLLVWSHVHSIAKLFETVMEFVVCNLREICYQSQWNKFANEFPDLCVLATQRIAGPPIINIASDSE